MENIKDFCTILPVKSIMVYSENNILTHNSTEHDCDRVLYQRLIIKEYGVEIKYIKGEHISFDDVLSIL